jgi:hypothetical protein
VNCSLNCVSATRHKEENSKSDPPQADRNPKKESS